VFTDAHVPSNRASIGNAQRTSRPSASAAVRVERGAERGETPLRDRPIAGDCEELRRDRRTERDGAYGHIRPGQTGKRHAGIEGKPRHAVGVAEVAIGKISTTGVFSIVPAITLPDIA
jgi:hypothetical protein